VHIESRKGIILDARVFSDSLYPGLIEALAQALHDVTYDATGVDQVATLAHAWLAALSWVSRVVLFLVVAPGAIGRAHARGMCCSWGQRSL